MKPRLLFLCTGNSARSQMAEGLARALGRGKVDVFSAGTHPKGLHPMAIEVMAEAGIDISRHRSKASSELEGQAFDYVITVCDQANEACPVWPGARERLHWSFEDPAAAVGSEAERLGVFRRVRDEIRLRVQVFLSNEVTEPAAIPLLEGPPPKVEVGVHDASRLAWNVTADLPAPGRGQLQHTFELELEVPTNLAAIRDPWDALQAYARLDGVEEALGRAEPTLTAFRGAVASVSSRLTRAGDGFSRHCTFIRSAPIVGEEEWEHLRLWVRASTAELARARSELLPKAPQAQEAVLANEFLSLKQWGVLTYCARVLAETRSASEDCGYPDAAGFDTVEASLAEALRQEMDCRRQAGFEVVEASGPAQLERLLARMGSFKKHFERVLFLDVESYEIVNRLSGWLSALMAALAYLWFLLWQITLERHAMALGSGVVLFAVLTAIAYASRERLKEVGRSWLAGRVQRIFAQRVTRYRVPAQDRKAAGAVVVSARESFSQSTARRPDPAYPEEDITREVTLLRFSHRGRLISPSSPDARSARQIRFVYRLDLSPLFPRLHDAVRGLATLDPHTGKLAIIDVSRNYELPLRVTLTQGGESEELRWGVILNKNGLVRIERRRAAPS